MFLVVGCVDLDELWNEIDFLKKQNAEKAKELEEENAKFAAFEELYKSVEKLTNSANSEITSLKGLIDALSNRLSVVSYKELEDKSGYELTMSDGSKITLKHGAKGAAGKDGKDGAEGEAGIDGITPEISVKLHTDGLLYWTLNGEFLLDADGNMIPAQGKDGKAGKDGKDGADGAQGTPGKDGKDGKDGATGATGAAGKDAITPLLRINSDLYWEMSLDGGLKWQLVTDANKRPLKAQGPRGSAGAAGQGIPGPQGPTGQQGAPGEKGEPGKDGDANLTITETETTITIIYNGVTFTIPKGEMPPLKMTLTTTKNVGDTISLYIEAADADQADVWIDLNNNGIKDSGEDDILFDNYKDYTLGAQTVTIYGKVTMLGCYSNSLSTLDVTKNTALQGFDCCDNLLSTLDVTKNTALTYLDCYGNSLSTLDVTKNTALQKLYCSGNSLTALDVTNNTALTLLNCSSNSLTTLDVSHNAALQELYCYQNSLSALDLTHNIKLEDLNCSGNSLTTLNTSNNPLLCRLHCENNQLTALDVTNNTALEELRCHGNQIKEVEMETLVNSLVDRSGILKGKFYVHDPDKPTNVITKAQVLKANGKNWKVYNDMSTLYDGQERPYMILTTTNSVGGTIRLNIDAASDDRAVVWIDLNNNGIKDANEANITFGSFKNYTLGAQTVTIYGNVTVLDCNTNSLTVLDLSKNTALKHLDCNTNSLTALDVTNNTALEKLYCYGNQIKEAEMGTLVSSLVDRSSFTTAGEFRVYSSAVPNNVINKTQVASAKAKKWNVLDNEGNDYEGTEGAYTATSMILTTTKNVGDMINLFIGAEEADQADVWIDLNNNGAKEEGESITNFTGYVDYTIGSKTITIYGKVTKLFCSSNALTNIDVTNNTTLQKLQCTNNLLTSIDLSNNTELLSLYCNANLITALDFSNNTKLNEMRCHNNQIKETEMGVMVNSMPNRQGKTGGTYMIVALSGNEGNEFTDTHKNILTSKNWQEW